MAPKRKVRTLVRNGEDFQEFPFFDDAAEFLGVRLNEALEQLLDQLADETATIVLLEHKGQMQVPKTERRFATAPKEHRAALFASGIALMYTMPSRDPVLVVDTGDTFVMIATSSDRLGAFLASRWKQPVSVEPPPKNVAERWVISLTPRLGLCRWSVGIGVAPGTPKA